MSENPVAGGPADASGADAGDPSAGPRRDPKAWLLVTVLAVLAAVLVYAVVMVVRMLS
ncbi:MAG TPA: hypothetical protein VLH10_11670 [Yinghuangia sp.]|uniref:hypothetical protein n=1 Tax=Yinghuangia sp. YIM S10712 TaxID=3436930 RepID=UPI002C8D0793|nr:hypothetical protein [Yinghuangia sp.]